MDRERVTRVARRRRRRNSFVEEVGRNMWVGWGGRGMARVLQIGGLEG